MTAVLLHPVSPRAFNQRLRELGHEIPVIDPDMFAPLCEELAKPIPGDDVEVDHRESSTLLSRPVDWSGRFKPNGKPIIYDKAFGEWRHHGRKDRR